MLLFLTDNKMSRWLYNQGGEIIEIIIRDAGGGKIETIKFSVNDKKRIKFVIQILKNKYNVDLTGKKSDKDIDWLKQDF